MKRHTVCPDCGGDLRVSVLYGVAKLECTVKGCDWVDIVTVKGAQ